MLNTKLIFIDGLTGSGKSTFAHYLARQLEKNGIETRWLYEVEVDHPLIEFTKADQESDSDFTQRVLRDYPQKWIDFVEKIKDDKCVYILESYPFQNVIYIPYHNDFDKQIIKDHVHQICSITACLNPVLIHFYQLDHDRAIRENCQRRSERWRNYLITREEQTLFCKNRNLLGEAAPVELWRAISNLADELFKEITFPKIKIENSEHKWDEYRRQILNFLELETIEEKLFDPSFEKYCGYYADKYWFFVHIKNNRLYLDQFWKNLKLHPLGEDEFEIEGFPVVLKFFADEKGEFTTIRVVKSKTGPDIYIVGDEGHKITPVEFSKAELEKFCGNYRCEIKELDRKIYVKDGELNYWRAENNVSVLVPLSQTKFAINGARATIEFEFNEDLKKFIFKAPNQDDMLFVSTNPLN